MASFAFKSGYPFKLLAVSATLLLYSARSLATITEEERIRIQESVDNFRNKHANTNQPLNQNISQSFETTRKLTVRKDGFEQCSGQSLGPQHVQIALNKSWDVNRSLQVFTEGVEEIKTNIRLPDLNLDKLASTEDRLEPVPLHLTKKIVRAVEGDEVEISCINHGKPLPVIHWGKKIGKLGFEKVDYGNNGTVFRIKHARVHDRGTYVCVAFNGVRSPVLESFKLQVALSGLFAATEAGLISLDLRNFKAKVLTNAETFGVAVNHKQRKVYWSEINDNSRIMRSNFDGSAKEIIVPPTGDFIFMLAIDESSEKVYFSLLNSNEITVCNALGKNCSPAISSTLFVTGTVGFALDSENGVAYWGKRWWLDNYLVRSYLNGTRAKAISTNFQNIHGITIDRDSNDGIYWADQKTNTIGFIDVNGGNQRTLVQLRGDPKPWGIQVDGDKIYFSNINSRNIQSVDKHSGKNLKTIYSSTAKVRHLALFSTFV